MGRVIACFLIGPALVLLGALLMFAAHRVRRAGLSYYAEPRRTGKLVPFLQWMKAEEMQHLWSIRIGGGMAVLMGSFLVYAGIVLLKALTRP